MSTDPLIHEEKRLGSVCDRALGEDIQEPVDERELLAFEAVAAALAVGLCDLREEMPEDARANLLRRLDTARPGVGLRLRGTVDEDPAPSRARPWRSIALAGWSLAAVLAIVASLFVFAQSQSDPKPGDIRQARQRLIARGIQPIAFSEWSDEQIRAMFPGVEGDVVWDDATQEGYLRLRNLPVNDPEEFQYQLWILDGRFADPLSQRISGGVFDVTGEGEVIVPIDEWMPVQRAVGFAVTVEQPGGVWVSDMTKRVAIALRQS